MRTKSKILIAGARAPLVVSNGGKSSESRMWNLRLELGHRLHPTPLRTTEFAPAQPQPLQESASEPSADVTYGPPQWARAAQMGGLAGDAFIPQPDGTLRCPGFAASLRTRTTV
jgi:hypothetical protein